MRRPFHLANRPKQGNVLLSFPSIVLRITLNVSFVAVFVLPGCTVMPKSRSPQFSRNRLHAADDIVEPMKVSCSKSFNGACCEGATSGDQHEDWQCRGVGGCEGVTTRGVHVALRMVFDRIPEVSKDDIIVLTREIASELLGNRRL